MPRIGGTTSDDDIDVTNNNGTLNGGGQGSPIENIRGRAGDDEITVTDSTIAGPGTNSGNIIGNMGNDTITVTNSVVTGRVSGGDDTDTITVVGSTVGTIRLGVGDDTLNIRDTTVDQDLRGGRGTDALNLPVGTVVTDEDFGTFTVERDVTYSVSEGTFTLPTGQVVTYSSFETGSSVPCFTRDTRILTASGERPVQSLKVGDLVPTLGQGLQPVRWVGRRQFGNSELLDNPHLRPVRIMSGALGQGLPRRDLLVSRQHRMMIQSKIAERMFGSAEVLIPAIRLCVLPGVFVDEDVTEVEYLHLMFDAHQVIFAETAPTESLFTGAEALKALGSEARREIFDIFPELRGSGEIPQPARFIPSGRRQKALLERHRKNGRPMMMGEIAGSAICDPICAKKSL